MSRDEYLQPDVVKLKMLWLNRAFADEAEQREAAENFDILIRSLLEYELPDDQRVSDLVGTDVPEEDPNAKPMSQMFLELMIELDSAVKMIPPKVSAYRDLLAQHGLDASARKDGQDGDDAGGRQGIAGINVADQGALEYHGALMHLASMFANAVLNEANSSDSTSPND